MAYGTHHTIEIWNENGTITKFDTVLHMNTNNYQWNSSADQHEVVQRASATWHVITVGHPVPRAFAENLVLSAEAGHVLVVKLVQE